MRFIRLLFGLAASLVLAACGGGWGDAPGRSSLAPQSAAVASTATSASTTSTTRQYVDGYYIEKGDYSVPAQVNRLYRSILARPADAAGLGFHVASIERYGRTLADVVNGFMASPEFTSTYGSLDDAAFVKLLYTNVLHRQPDAQGFAYWTNLLAAGTARAQVVIGFSESPENIQATAPDVSAGLKFLPYPETRLYLADGTYIESNTSGTAAQVYRLYQAAFNRAADTGGLGFQIGNMETYGLSLQQIAQNFIASPEFAAKYGALDNTAFVTQLYANVLHRDPDPDGLAFHVGNLDSGVSRASVLTGFSESPENQSNTDAAIAAGIRFTPWPAAPAEPAVALAAVAPQIVTQPKAATVKNGVNIALSVVASGYGELQYQWSRGGVPIPGATTDAYTVPASFGDDGANFTVTVTSGLGQVKSSAATITVTPSTFEKNVAVCKHITSPGTYNVTANLTAGGGVPCVYIHDTQDVQLDCGGHTLSWDGASHAEGLEVLNVKNLSVKNCVVNASWLKVSSVTNGSFTNNRFTGADDALFGYAVVNFLSSIRMTFDSNTVASGVFQQFYGDRNTISNNVFTAANAANAGSGLVASVFGSGSRIYGNSIDGMATAADWGAYEGVVVQDESGAAVEDNTVKDVRNCGVTFLGVISGASVQRNTFTNAQGCGVGGSAWLSLSGSTFAGNTAQGSTMLFNLQRKYGLRAAGFDDSHKLPADTGVYFRDNVFSGNRLLSPRSSDGVTYAWGAYMPLGNKLDYDGQVSAIAGEKVPPASSFGISNNTFTGNDFGHIVKTPWLGSVVPQGMVVDGGGNVCSAPEIAAYPLTCN